MKPHTKRDITTTQGVNFTAEELYEIEKYMDILAGQFTKQITDLCDKSMTIKIWEEQGRKSSANLLAQHTMQSFNDLTEAEEVIRSIRKKCELARKNPPEYFQHQTIPPQTAKLPDLEDWDNPPTLEPMFKPLKNVQ